MLDADLYRLEEKLWKLSAGDVLSVMNGTIDVNGVGSMPVDTCYPSDLGWGVRQTTSRSKHSDFGFTWIIGRGGLRCEVWIPLQKYKARGGQCHVTEFEKYENAHQFFDLLKESKATDSEVLDLNQLWVVLSAVLDRFFGLLDRNNTPADTVYGKVILKNVWHTVPFLDSKIFLNRIGKFGLPICLSSESMILGGVGADSFYKLITTDQMDEDFRRMSFITQIMEGSVRKM